MERLDGEKRDIKRSENKRNDVFKKSNKGDCEGGGEIR